MLKAFAFNLAYQNYLSSLFRRDEDAMRHFIQVMYRIICYAERHGYRLTGEASTGFYFVEQSSEKELL